jgi:hypothetical protein
VNQVAEQERTIRLLLQSRVGGDVELTERSGLLSGDGAASKGGAGTSGTGAGRGSVKGGYGATDVSVTIGEAASRAAAIAALGAATQVRLPPSLHRLKPRLFRA